MRNAGEFCFHTVGIFNFPPSLLPIRATDFSPLKFHRPQAGLDARSLGPIASMINTTPPRATILKLKYDNQVNSLQLIAS